MAKGNKCANVNCDNILVRRGIYCGKCRERLHKHGNLDTVLPKHRKYTINDKFCDTWTKESAWFIGWLATDGYVDEKIGAITFGLKDLEPLEYIARIVGSNKEPIKYKTNNTKENGGFGGCGYRYQLKLNSRILCNQIVKLGIRQAKSLTVPMVNVPDEFLWHYIRGLVEGDGSVIWSKNSLSVYIISASKTFVDGFSERIKIPHTIQTIDKTEKGYKLLYRIVFYGDSALELCNLIYKDSDELRLDRKYQKYLMCLNHKSTFKRQPYGPNLKVRKNIECNGMEKSSYEWSEISGISQQVIMDRIQRGWNAELAIFAPVGYKRTDKDKVKSTKLNKEYIMEKSYTFYGKTLLKSEWSEITQVPEKIIRERLYQGWDEQMAFFAPVGYNRKTGVVSKPRTKS